MSNIIRRHTDHMKFAAYMAVPFIIFFHIFLLHFVSLYIWLYVLYASVEFCRICILIFMFKYSYFYVYVFLCFMFIYTYCYVWCVLCILFHCVVLCIVCVQMCTVILPPGVNPIAVNKNTNYNYGPFALFKPLINA